MSNNNPQLQISADHQLASWLESQNLSLAFTTYQTNRICLVSSSGNGRLKVSERLFDKPMGLYTCKEKLYLACRYQLWQFGNLLESGEKYGSADRLYVPRIAHTTGDINAHEVVLDGSGKLIFVNTDFSCLATLSPDYNFVPLWQPPFISKLVAEDKCHLNGLAMVAGKPAYVTACSATDRPVGWRNHRRDGGVVIDVEQNEIIATGLSMPHSPRWYQGKLWLLNSGTGELGYLDGDKFVPITFCPGFVRGLAFWDNFALVGLSKVRSPQFTGLALEERLQAQGNDSHCGLMVIDIHTGEVVHWLHMGSVIEELFDIVILPGVRQPQILGLQGDGLQRLVRFPDSGGVVVTKPTVERPSLSQTPTVAGLPTQKPAKLPVKFQCVYNLNPSNALAYDRFTYPSLQKRWQKQAPRGELLGVSAAIEGSMVGFTVAEKVSADRAEVISLLVLPEFRHQGIGTKLLLNLERELTKQGCQQIELVYKSTPTTSLALEPLLKQLNWQPPTVKFLLGKTTMEKLSPAPWLRKYPLPKKFTVFPWHELTDADKQQLQILDYPTSLSPLSKTPAEPLNSLGLRYESQLVGWMVTHRVATDAIRYSTLFVDKRFQKRGRGISLLSESILRQVASTVPYGLFAVAEDNPAMLQFVRKHLQPYLIDVTDSKVALKQLSC